MPTTVKLIIRRDGADEPELPRFYEHERWIDALRYAYRLIADACRWGAGDVFDVSIAGLRWRVFGPRAGCGGRAEIMRRRDRGSWTWESVSAACARSEQLATSARIAPPARSPRARYVDSSRFVPVCQATTGDAS